MLRIVSSARALPVWLVAAIALFIVASLWTALPQPDSEPRAVLEDLPHGETQGPPGSRPTSSPSSSPAASEPRDADSSATLLHFSREKQVRAGVQVEPVERRAFLPFVTVMGRAEWAPRKTVVLRAPVDLRVVEVFEDQGAEVRRGQPLATLESRAIGDLRTRITQLTLERALAERQWQWSRSIRQGVEFATRLVDEALEPEQFASRLRTVQLGDHRGEIVGTYAEWWASKALYVPQSDASANGAIPGRTLETRRQRYVAATSTLHGKLEHLAFDSQQVEATTSAALSAKQHALEVSLSDYEALVGEPFGSAKDASPSSRWVLKSPQDGQLVEFRLATDTRWAAGEPLGTVADGSTLWVSCPLNREMLAQLSPFLTPGQTCHLRVNGQQTVQGIVKFVGAKLESATGTVTVVIEVANPSFTLRNGLLVDVDLPAGPAQPSLLVPASAIVEIDGQPSVLLRRSDEQFEARPVKIGQMAEGQVQILSGIEVGDRVVTEGAFPMASELMLEPEE